MALLGHKNEKKLCVWFDILMSYVDILYILTYVGILDILNYKTFYIIRKIIKTLTDLISVIRYCYSVVVKRS